MGLRTGEMAMGVIAFEIYDLMPNWFVISVFVFATLTLLVAIFVK